MSIEKRYENTDTGEIFNTYDEAFQGSEAGVFKTAVLSMDFIYHCDEENWDNIFDITKEYFAEYFDCDPHA